MLVDRDSPIRFMLLNPGGQFHTLPDVTVLILLLCPGSDSLFQLTAETIHARNPHTQSAVPRIPPRAWSRFRVRAIQPFFSCISQGVYYTPEFRSNGDRQYSI